MTAPYLGYEWGQLLELLTSHPEAVIRIHVNAPDYPVRIDSRGEYWLGFLDDHTARRIQIWLEAQVMLDTQKRLAK